MKLHLPGLVAAFGFIAAGLLALLGTILPWAYSPLGPARSGTDTDDGKLVMVLAILLAGLGIAKLLLPPQPVSKWTTLLVGAFLGILLAVIAIYDIVDAQRLFQSYQGLIRVGSGLYVTALAGVAAFLAAGAGLFEDTSPLVGPTPILATPLDHAVRAPVPGQDRDPMALLMQLKNVHELGVITDEEFASRKERLLFEMGLGESFPPTDLSRPAAEFTGLSGTTKEQPSVEAAPAATDVSEPDLRMRTGLLLTARGVIASIVSPFSEPVRRMRAGLLLTARGVIASIVGPFFGGLSDTAGAAPSRQQTGTAPSHQQTGTRGEVLPPGTSAFERPDCASAKLFKFPAGLVLDVTKEEQGFYEVAVYGTDQRVYVPMDALSSGVDETRAS